MTGDQMDDKRSQKVAYEYLCHLEEAKKWMEHCLKEELPESTELEEGLRNGVYLAKLGHFFSPTAVPLRKIYDKDFKRFEVKGLHFKHTDNINHFYRAMEHIGLPRIFYPETTDIYDRKNMPRTIYCLHALSLFLFKIGVAPQMEDLYGIAEFTEEQVTIMQSELTKYGIKMPQFSKIGGILANELSVDEATLHAAVIAINEALSNGDPVETLSKLKNPSACLNGVSDENAIVYQDRLLNYKNLKIEASKAKVQDKNVEDRDMYEELLTHAELQGNLKKINLDVQLEELNNFLQKDDVDDDAVISLLKMMEITNLNDDNIKWYKEHLLKDLDDKKQQNENDESIKLDKEEIQKSINNANISANKHRARAKAISNINSLLLNDDVDPQDLINILIKPEAEFPEIYTEKPIVYYEELREARTRAEKDLSHDDISKEIPILNLLSKLNKDLEAGDVSCIWGTITSPLLNLQNLDDAFRTRICEGLIEAKTCVPYLKIDQIQNKINEINDEIAEEQARIEGVNNLNEILENGDEDAVLQSLQNPALQLKNVESSNIIQYIRLLKKKKSEKEEQVESSTLWIDEIQQCVDLANHQTRVALKQASAVAAVNMSLDDPDYEQTYEMLRHQDIAIAALTPECASSYHEQLIDMKREKIEEGKTETDWVLFRTREGDDYYFNIDLLEGSWSKPDNFNPNTIYLSKDEIQERVSFISAAYDRVQMWKDNEFYVIKLQSYVRMHIERKRYSQRKNFIDNQLPAIVTIQSAWRGHLQKQKYQRRLEYFRENARSIVILQTNCRMWRQRSKYQNRLQYFQNQTPSIVKLQAWFRSNKARHDYRTLIGVENPPLPVVQRFVHLLDQRANDFTEEMELQELKKAVIGKIKGNNEHEKALNSMDIKIGLLVKNRITLQDVINHSHHIRKKTTKNMASNENMAATGLKALNKTNRARLEAYQHLFYLLQTNPTYFGKLIFKMPAGRSTDFMQQVIFAVYNYASNSREEYLLLKLFRTALQEEIESKVDKVKEIATGNPLVIKMVVSFNRGAKGNSSLRQILAPQVKEVMKKKHNINTSPIEIYKNWISQRETETGEASDLPYTVNIEEAMKHEEVRKRVAESVDQLQAATEGFMNAIVTNLESIPYGLRYIAKCLRNLLMDKFPDTADEEVLKMVGNLIYYRFINPAVIGPDVFDIIDVTAGGSGLNNDQRKNLGSIAKVLQFASTGKTFAGDLDYLDSINDYLRDAYKRFKNFFIAVCDVPEPEEKHNMDEFSDAVLLVKPVIFISLKEVVDTHKLLVEHAEEIAPDATDPIHDMLEELGEVPEYSTLLGSSYQNRSSIREKRESRSNGIRFE